MALLQTDTVYIYYMQHNPQRTKAPNIQHAGHADECTSHATALPPTNTTSKYSGSSKWKSRLSNGIQANE